jgi:hypothetical protein
MPSYLNAFESFSEPGDHSGGVHLDYGFVVAMH